VLVISRYSLLFIFQPPSILGFLGYARHGTRQPPRQVSQPCHRFCWRGRVCAARV
jgi:hypothetical protein